MSPATKKSARGRLARAQVAVTPATVGDGTLAALQDTLTALCAETGPKAGHGHSRELTLCWNAAFRDLEKIEQAFLCQEELAQTLAEATRDVAAARRASVLAPKAERLRHAALGIGPSSDEADRTVFRGAALS